MTIDKLERGKSIQESLESIEGFLDDFKSVESELKEKSNEGKVEFKTNFFISDLVTVFAIIEGLKEKKKSLQELFEIL